MIVHRSVNTRSLLIGLLLIAGGLGVGYYIRQTDTTHSVTSFIECVEKGYPIAESDPRQCFTPDGRVYIEDTAETLGMNQTLAPEGFVQVFIHFPRRPQSISQFAYTESVTRLTNDANDLIAFAIDELIAGPEDFEAEQGYFSPLQFQGESSCDDRNYEYTYNTNDKLVTIRFCKDVPLPNTGDSTRILSSIVRTLTELETVDSVVVQDREGFVWKP